MKRKYERYISEIKHMSYPAKAGEKPFREFLVVDSNDIPSITHHFEVFIIRKDGVRDGISDVAEIPPEAAKVQMKRLHSGLPDQPPGMVWPPLWQTKEGKFIFRGWPMYHTADEIFLFFGTDPDNPTDLGGEVEFWLGLGEDAEKYIITKPSCIYVPAGLVHAPIVFRNVRRPFIEVICYTKPVLDEHGVPVVPPDYKPPKK
jgi:mannose-6-phosphate isomerase-like protein (cupin superfamily)